METPDIKFVFDHITPTRICPNGFIPIYDVDGKLVDVNNYDLSLLRQGPFHYFPSYPFFHTKYASITTTYQYNSQLKHNELELSKQCYVYPIELPYCFNFVNYFKNKEQNDDLKFVEFDGVVCEKEKFVPPGNYFKLISDTAKTLIRQNQLKVLLYNGEGYILHKPYIVHGDSLIPDTDITFSYHAETLITSLKKMAKEEGVSENQIYFVSGNFNSDTRVEKWKKLSKDQTDIHFSHYNVFKDRIQNINSKNYLKQADVDELPLREKHYMCLNRINRPHRMEIINDLYLNKLLDRGDVSFIAGDEDFILPEVLKMMPLTVDDASFKEKNNHRRSLAYLFKNSYFSLITETAFDCEGERFDTELDSFITEKTYKAMVNLHPFILMSGQYSLRYLKSLGFKTFSPLIDESYDEIEAGHLRQRAIVKEVKRLCDLPLYQLDALYRKLIDILVHNQNHLLSHSADTIDLDNFYKFLAK